MEVQNNLQNVQTVIYMVKKQQIFPAEGSLSLQYYTVILPILRGFLNFFLPYSNLRLQQ